VTSRRAVLAVAGRLVTPTAKEVKTLGRISERVIQRVKAAAARFPEVRDVFLGGSFAKGTWLPHGDVDLDVFVRMAEDVDASSFERVGLAVGEEAVKGYPHGKKYAQHPYTEARVDGVTVNVVPCYDVEPGKWKSAADRSPYHVEFVRGRMKEKEKAQVRLLKRFMRTVGVYGAEIEREGFSGYACEVLVYSHKTFDAVLSYFAGLKPEGETLLSLRDPVDPERELATAISPETLSRMVLASRAFLDEPELAYFKKVRRRTRRALSRRLYCVRFDHEALSEDTLWGELKKSTRQLVKHVEAQGFVIARSAAISNDTDKSAILLLPELDRLPEVVERLGPSVFLAEEVKRFVLKNRDKAELAWAAEDGRLHVLQKRRYRELGKLLDELRGGEIEKIGVSRDVMVSIRKNGRVLQGEAIVKERARESWFAEGVDSIIEDTIGTYPT
jgi:tRNA nucleotidyltransferase (CCA-adding enzyme)